MFENTFNKVFTVLDRTCIPQKSDYEKACDR